MPIFAAGCGVLVGIWFDGIPGLHHLSHASYAAGFLSSR